MALKGYSNKKPISSISNINLHIFVLGYKTQGESILVIFEDTDKKNVVYSFVIDSYFHKNGRRTINKTDEILRMHKINDLKLSALIWSHPHLDHTKGLNHILQKYTSYKTKVVFAPKFFNRENDIVNIQNKECKEVINRIFSLPRLQREETINRPSVAAFTYNEIDNVILEPYCGKNLDISLNAVAPCTGILDSKEHDNKRLDPNEISVSFIMNVNENYFLFAGDTTNAHINNINEDYLSKCIFVKIPHHASETSKNLVNYLDEGNPIIACATRFHSGKSNLPDNEVIGKYLEITKTVFSTGDHKHEKNDYGIIQYTCSFNDEGIKNINIKLEGNAFLYQTE